MAEGTDGATDAQGTEPYRILSDSPAVGGQDPLGFDDLAQRLGQTIVASHGSAPFTVSVEAGWGAGKSTLMRRLQHRFDRPPAEVGREPPIEIKTVWFNAWTAPESGVLEGLVRSVLDELDTNIIRRTARKQQLVRGLGIVASVGASLLGLSGIVDRVWQRVADDPKERNQLNEFVRIAMARWLSKRSLPDGGLIVVFVDDLDRCSSKTVMEVFEAVKLYLDAPGLVFVLGWDTEQVIDAVAKQKGDTDRLAHRYVEKIVQFGYRIRRPTDAQLTALLETFCEEAKISQEVLGEEHRELLIRTAGGNPRQMKRFLNRFILLHQVVSGSPDADDSSTAAVEADVVILLLVLQASYDGFYRLLASTSADVEDPDRENPLFEFTSYEQLRRAVDRHDGSTVTTILEDLGYFVSPEVDPSTVFESYERDQPREFPTLAQDPQFTDLLALMSDEDKRAVWALARSADVQGLELSADVTEGASKRVARDFASEAKTVLWVDDEPKQGDHQLLPDGVELLVASSTAEAERILKSRRDIDLLISDIGRGLRRNAGLDDLASFQQTGLYDGPAIFYTSHPTTGQVEDAQQLGADVTSHPGELVRLVRRYIPVMPDAGPSKMSKMSAAS